MGEESIAGGGEPSQEPTLGGECEAPVPAARESPYLLVFEGESTRVFRLPLDGEVIVGRAAGAHLRIEDGSVSRQHARLRVAGGVVRVADLGSHNGTLINGEPVRDERLLVSGDMVGIGTVTLAFHAPRAHAGRSFVPMAELRGRLEEEIDRSLRYERPLCLLAVAFAGGAPDQRRVGKSLACHLRRIDVTAWDTRERLFVLLPETSPQSAPLIAERLVPELTPGVGAARVGIASCPADGCQPDALLAAARAAAAGQPGDAGATPGPVAACDVLQVGRRPVIVADPAMRRVYALVERLAATELAVLVCGETGAGKDVVTSALHHWSSRRERPLVALNCAAMQETLAESELFGHARGAFSGAAGAKPGLLESAAGGTVLLDEIGELSLGIQAKLLRVLETRRVIPLGDVRERELDIRVLASTNRDLEVAVREGRFRRDLFFRLSAATLWLPPLRDRLHELPLLAQAFLREAAAALGRQPMVLSGRGLRRLAEHPWPGNVRELKNVMEYLTATCTDAVVEDWHLDACLAREGRSASPGGRLLTERPDRERDGAQSPGHDPHAGALGRAPDAGALGCAPADRARFRPIEQEIQELERQRMAAALRAAGGNRTRAAELISMPLRTFQTKLVRYGLRPGGKGM